MPFFAVVDSVRFIRILPSFRTDLADPERLPTRSADAVFWEQSIGIGIGFRDDIPEVRWLAFNAADRAGWRDRRCHGGRDGDRD
jgi:hypothetical protein